MATNKKISELPNATLPISAGVKFEALQGGVNVQVDADDMPGSAAPATSADLVAGTDNTKPLTSLAFKGFRDLKRTSVSVSAGTLTLTFAADEQERKFECTTAQSSNFTVAFGGTLTNLEEFRLILFITGTVAITFPSSVICGKTDERFANGTKILTLIGGTAEPFILDFTRINGPLYRLTASYASHAS